MTIKKTEDPTLDRDMYSKALLSTDARALQASRTKMKERLDVQRLQKDLNTVQGDIAAIKQMLTALVKDK
jgi:hypothetical protein